MLDVNSTIVSKLNEIGLKVYLEDFLDSQCDIPCISYREYSNVADIEGDTIGYSALTYHVKVWAKSMQDLTGYSCQVDAKMRELGFKRTVSNDLWLKGIGQRDMKYSNLALENF
jgi:hypothetical protein